MTRCWSWIPLLCVAAGAWAQPATDGPPVLVDRVAYDGSASGATPSDQGWTLRDDDGEADGLHMGPMPRGGWVMQDDSDSGSLLWLSGAVEGVGDTWTLSLEASIQEHTGSEAFCFQFGDGAQRWLVFLGETSGRALRATILGGGGRQHVTLLARNDRLPHTFTITRAPDETAGRLHFDGATVGEPFEPIDAAGVDGVQWGTGSSGGRGAAVVHAVALRAAPEPTIRLPWVLTSGMVVQRDQPIAVWGNAEPSAAVSVSFAGERVTTTADEAGTWRVALPAQPASAVGRDLVIAVGDVARVLSDVLVGEVWLCAGQSNMWWPMRSSLGGEVGADRVAANDAIRFLDPQPTVGLGGSVWPLEDALALTPARYFTRPGWTGGGDGAAAQVTAVGAWFGLALHEQLGVPVGLIDVAVGGTPVESWVPRDVVTDDPRTGDLEANFLASAHAQDFVRDRPLVHLRRWDEAGRPGSTPEHPFRPGFMFAAGIEPMLGLPIAGVLWYQGESNAEDTPMHDTLFRAAVASWREAFGREDLPVFWVQLPELNREMWPEFRAGQAALTDLPHTGMAVTIGLGHPTDVHPRDKAPVGERLARLALRRVYGVSIEDTGPTVADARREGRRLVLSIGQAASGLDLRGDASGSTGFWLADDDRRFARADAAVRGDALVLESTAVDRPVAVRYAWEANTVATLFNGVGLPAAPFRTDDWETIRVACVGDSITFGTGTGNATSNSYPAQLSRLAGPLFDVRAFGVPGASVVNGLIQARSGWDRGFAQQMAFQRSLVFEPDVVIINLGINDVVNEVFDADAFVADYVALIEAYRALPSEPTVVIWGRLAPLFPGQAFYNHPRLALIQDALGRVAEATGVHTIDMHTPLRDAGNLFPDHIHPDARGASRVAAVTRDALQRIGLPLAYEEDAPRRSTD